MNGIGDAVNIENLMRLVQKSTYSADNLHLNYFPMVSLLPKSCRL